MRLIRFLKKGREQATIKRFMDILCAVSAGNRKRKFRSILYMWLAKIQAGWLDLPAAHKPEAHLMKKVVLFFLTLVLFVCVHAQSSKDSSFDYRLNTYMM